jgi:hypothetical protein
LNAPATTHPKAPARTPASANARLGIEAHPVELHDQDLAPVVGASRDLIVLVHVRYSEGEMGDVAVLHDYARPLHLEPVVDCSVRSAEELFGHPRIERKPLIRPLVDAVERGQMVPDAIIRVVVKDVVLPPAVPDHRILRQNVGTLER